MAGLSKPGVRLAAALLSLSLLSGCGAAVGTGIALATTAGSMMAVNQAGKSAANSAARIEQMNCQQLRAEHQRTKGWSINPTNTAVHATTIDVMRAKGCRIPG